MAIQVGSAWVNITPPLTIPYLGYLPRQSYFQGVHDPLYARALVMDNGEERIGILSADAIGLANHLLGPGRHFTDELRARVAQKDCLQPDRLMVACTHAHSTPETLGITRLLDVPEAAPWLEVLLDQLASAVAMACRLLQPCTLKVGRGEMKGVARNRRQVCQGMSLEEQIAAGKLDTQLQVLLCEDDEGNASEVMINFQCHPVTVQVQPLVSADFPGVATQLVEENLPGCRTCFYLQGAAGNLDPLRGDTRDFRDVFLYGTMIAGETLKIAARLLGDPSAAMEDFTLKTASRRVTIPPRPLPERQEWADRLADALERERKAATDQERLQAAGQAQQCREVLGLVDRYTTPQEAEAQVLRIGSLAIASTPGEMFTEWGLKIKKESKAPYTFVSELTNGWVGYLLNPGGFAEGGYEASYGTWTQTGEEGAALLTETAIELIAELWE
ncbi:MAG: neutral/alkaline non-lysosomal ceramidase N-terminal domain-containing protein [Armatimonadetes bacterium]|nr:neutral/alkaline non-lysosomal ceramidase N-terminal domain-containing protein [Armatimonadota bacterium]